MTAQNIMDSMKFSAQVAPVQSDLFTPSHVLYKCKVVNNGKQYTFDYQCNPTYKAPNIEDCLYCLFSDASCVDCVADVDDFLREMGYTDIWTIATEKITRSLMCLSSARSKSWNMLDGNRIV